MSVGEFGRAHFVEGATATTGESELEHLVNYLMADFWSTEKDLIVRREFIYLFIYLFLMRPRVGLVLARARRMLG